MLINTGKDEIRLLVVSQQYDFVNKAPKAPSIQSTKPVEVPQATTEAVANGEQQEGKDKKEKKKKPAKEG